MGKFVDSIVIQVQGGHGGAGSVHYRREKYVPRGGPDGGDGGNGGSVMVKINPQLYNLDHLDTWQTYCGENGAPGSGQRKSGKGGKDLILNLPPGSVITDNETGEMLLDTALLQDTENPILVASGGKGGLGNVHFSSSVNQTPDYAQPGLPGDAKELKIELKLIADIGFVGLPNAGKSTMLSKLTNAQPKIGDYPFTTLIPQLGVLDLEAEKGPVRLKLADIPGIIEGAHKGSGLGLSFLQHIERVQMIIFLIGLDSPDPVYNFKILRAELLQYSKELVKKPFILVFSKLDLIEEDDRADLQNLYFEEVNKVKKINKNQIFFVSALSGNGLDGLKANILKKFQKLKPVWN